MNVRYHIKTFKNVDYVLECNIIWHVSNYFLKNVTTRKFKITYIAHIVFWMDSPGLESPSDADLSFSL